MKTFAQLGVPDPLLVALNASGITDPFPIQRDTLPDALSGRDILGRGKTGSGKTIAFSVPLVNQLRLSTRVTRPGHPRGLVLAPTRELATQIRETIEPLAAAFSLRVATVFGGVSQKPQEKALRSGVDIIVACPGRLEDLMQQGIASLDSVEVTVIDEADHMADLGFLPSVTRILMATPRNGQRLLFSATLDRGVDGLADRFLNDPVRHSVDEASVPVGALSHRVLSVETPELKKELVRELASGLGRRILFTRTKHQAKKLAKQLTTQGIPAVDLHGNLSQGARERNLSAFSGDPAEGGVRVLVATDVAARGVHVDNVDLVVHVDPPVEHKAYLHRSGRTARAGASGTVVTIVLPEQQRDVASLLRKAQISVALEPTTAGTIEELVGERAPHVKPAPVQQTARTGNGRGGAGRSAGGAGRSSSGARRRPRGSNERSSSSASAPTRMQPRRPGHSGHGQNRAAS